LRVQAVQERSRVLEQWSRVQARTLALVRAGRVQVCRVRV